MLTGNLGLFIAGFILNFLAAFIIVRFVYYPRGRCNNYVFTFLAFNTVIYFIMGLFTSIEISIGAGFGLFALFSILRYRTETVPIREMTYLFVMAALPILNSIFWTSGQFDRILIVDILVLAVMWFLDREWGFNREQSQMNVVYEKIDLIKREKRDEMIADLSQRTGLAVTDVEIQNINFLRDVAEVRITYWNKK
ncbi:MAG: hypothetical protein A4E42_00735 [Methanoregulaceae archaeon PtaU1.Bin222]|nr:MAG: hypothetical protein A4E42_00735 [Methanoregulaceae archaeon PtaU1.Bin222]